MLSPPGIEASNPFTFEDRAIKTLETRSPAPRNSSDVPLTKTQRSRTSGTKPDVRLREVRNTKQVKVQQGRLDKVNHQALVQTTYNTDARCGAAEARRV